jgi:hypothetical protein
VLIALLVVLAVVAVAGATAVAVTNKRKFAAANEVIPGVSSSAPAAWAGAHTPEARLHRRLRDAMTALRTHPVLEEVGLLELRVTIEQHALAVDERLIAAAALPERVRDEPLARVADEVAAIEDAVARVAGADTAAAADATALSCAVSDLTAHLAAIEAARAELDAAEPGAARRAFEAPRPDQGVETPGGTPAPPAPGPMMPQTDPPTPPASDPRRT